MDQTTTSEPAQKPSPEYAWHRHPLLIAVITAGIALLSSVLTIGLGQAGALPDSVNPAPPATTLTATTTETATVTAAVTETVTATPTDAPSTPESSTPVVLPGGALAITVGLSNGGKIGPAEYRVGSVPHVYAEVRDGSGVRQSNGCYPTWVLKRGSATILTSRGEKCDAWFYLNRDSLSVRGTYHVTVSVTTDAGLTGTKTADFTVT